MNEYDFVTAAGNIAKHEAGHWLAAFKLGWSPRGIGLRVPSHAKDHKGYSETSHRVDLSGIDDVRYYARGRVKILYSGVYAEHFDGKDFDNASIMRDLGRGGGAISDFWKAEEIYFFYYNCLDIKGTWEQEFQPIICDVQLMIEMHYDFITSVAKYVMARANFVGQSIEVSSSDLISIFKNSTIKLPDHDPLR
ncbi:TPA: hypothetical protein HIF23_003842 [Escherichia coli]|nr:hypothetical protein [Escherichia coli]HAH9894007.1 hypothetical protein [Escherichia coli]